MSIYFKQIGLVLLFISAIIFVPLNVQADSIFSVGYLALERPVDEVAVIRPILSALEKLLNKGKEPYHIKSHVVRSKELFKKLISKNTIHFLRCEPILCQELMEADPSLRVIAMETVQGSAKDEFYLVSLLGDETHDLAGGGRILLGAPGSAAGDFLPRFKLFKEGFKKSDFESVDYEVDEAKRVGALLAGKTDMTILSANAFSKYKDKVKLLRNWQVQPEIWLATQKLDQFEYQIVVSLLPKIPSEAFKKISKNRSLITKEFPDMLEVLQSWHMAWLFDQ